MSNITLFPGTTDRVAQWSTQPEVVGLLLVGSKSRGHADALSDDDLEVLLTDEAFAQRVPTDCIELLEEGEGLQRLNALFTACIRVSLPYGTLLQEGTIQGR